MESQRAKLILLIAAPGVGKTWVANKAKHELGFWYVPNDEFLVRTRGSNQRPLYWKSLLTALKESDSPVITDVPAFAATKVVNAIEAMNIDCEFIALACSREEQAKQFFRREQREIPNNFLEQTKHVREWALDQSWRIGKSEEVFEYIKVSEALWRRKYS